MAAMLLRAASRVYVSTDAWRRYLAPYTPGGRPQDLVTLPVPSAIPRCDRVADIADRRRQLLGASTHQLVGHFGTVGSQVAPMLEAALIPLLTSDPNVSAVCLGSGSDEFVRALVANVADDPRPDPRRRPRLSLRRGTHAECVRSPPAAVSRRRHDATDVGHGRSHQRRAIVTTTGHLTRAGLGGDRRRGPCRRRQTPKSVVATVRACSPKTTTAPHSPRAARRRIASASRSTTRFARFEERSKARPHECGSASRSASRRAIGRKRSSAVSGRWRSSRTCRPKYSCSTMPRRRR